jgi:uncharacterized protein DUF6188
MPQKLNPSEMILESLRGSSVTSVDHYAEDSWRLNFEAAGLNIQCPWRIVSNGAVVLGGSDHEQKFGLPQPVDVAVEALRLLNGRSVESARIDETTADLFITFASDVRVDVFNDSSGYEGWTFADQRGTWLVAQGGGQMAIWKPAIAKM